ncbi:pyridoxal phosphate-dependent aminotransferase [Corynebacterium kozikiae]|uniref:pyridoxal phosphate-dependent aminotransferase n=1 Tax=Corynebacterium kozikiae TaxID=2968469 RepID=UPI00211C205A|nr:aminotransferase class I/II-fold pyridoxal phosphate-dependent enzyme [Corynebacterium sp. 76QC2CO]MCQ9343661.1 aminotransferase class I/II-fold pyridoxal phosphate-dependent enzyme [Corynebacterium sp. 76QC2CO]
MVPSPRGEVEPFRVMQILGKAQQREDALLLCVGQPRAGAPGPVLAAASEALVGASLGYTATLGLPELRAAIARWHAHTYGTPTRAEQVVVTTGSSGGFVAAFLALLSPGDAVALARPGYPAYRNTLHALGAEVVELDCGPETRYQPTVEHLEACGRELKMVIVTSPDNPTGTIIDPAELQRIARWCERRDVVLLSDEIYHGISYGQTTATARQFSPEAITVGSMSKFFCMTGWRLGWLIMPEHLVETFDNLQANLALCPPAIAQHAALAAFTPDSLSELRSHVREYAETRDYLTAELPKLGLGSFAPPDGGFYLWVDVSHLTDDSEAWAADLLEETGVAVAPGKDFDTTSGHKFIRISFCISLEQARQAVVRLAEWLG